LYAARFQSKTWWPVSCYLSNSGNMMQVRTVARVACYLAVVLALGSCNRSPEVQAARATKRGLDYMQNQDYRRAVLEFLNAAQLLPQNAGAQYQLAKAYRSLGDGAAAVRAYRKAIG